MKFYKVLFIIVVLAFLILPIPMPGTNGVYNSFSNLYWCSDHYSCLHEKAHQMDRNQKQISHSDEWSNALYLYVIVQTRNNEINPFVVAIMSSYLNPRHKFYYVFNDPSAELYANIYALSNGNRSEMPESLAPFYLWDTND